MPSKGPSLRWIIWNIYVKECLKSNININGFVPKTCETKWSKKKVPKRDGSIKDHLARGKKSHIAAEMYPLDCNKPITIQCVYAMSCLEICCVRQTWFETLKPFVRNCSKHTTFKCISAIKQSRLKLLEWYFECILLQQNKASQLSVRRWWWWW